MRRDNLITALRGTGIALSAIAAIATTTMWVRSYTYAERLHGWLAARRCFLVASQQGRIVAMSFPPAFHPAHWRWQICRYSINNPLAFPGSDLRKHESCLGFGIITDPLYTLDQLFSPPRAASTPSLPPQPDPTTAAAPFILSYANFVVLRGAGIIVPYWFLVTLFAANGLALSLKRPWQFSLRGFFIFVTLVAFLLGLVAVIDN